MWPTDAHELKERKKERKKEISRSMLERKNPKNEKKRYARSGNGRLVVGGLHADVLVVFRQTWFLLLLLLLLIGHDDFRTTTTTRKVRYFNVVLWLKVFVVLKFYLRNTMTSMMTTRRRRRRLNDSRISWSPSPLRVYSNKALKSSRIPKAVPFY